LDRDPRHQAHVNSLTSRSNTSLLAGRPVAEANQRRKVRVMTQGRFRVSINGFRVTSPTTDTIWQTDGKWDEVLISVSVKAAKADGSVVYENQATTPVMGDTWRLPGRIQAGSASDLGGLKAGDSFPTSTPWVRTTPLSNARDYPPYTVWEGDLREGEDITFITPAIFEYDDGPGLLERFVDWHVQTDSAFGTKAKEIWTKPFPWIGWIFDAVSLGIQTAGTLWDGTDQTRPIGMMRDPADPSGKRFVFNPWVLPLTYDRAKAIVADNPTGRGNGILQARYPEPSPLSGDYTLFLQVEEVTASTVTDQWRDAGHANHVVSMTALDGRLYCVTADNTLWVRDPSTVEVDWQPIGQANDVTGLAGINGRLFCSDRQNRLWVRLPQVGSPWVHVGHANDVASMTAQAGILFCATADGRLWARPPIDTNTNWMPVGEANNVRALASGAGTVICATADGGLHVRPALPLQFPWAQVGSTPAGLTGLAGVGDLLFAATTTNRLMVRSVV
jgi:hypothetical protein